MTTPPLESARLKLARSLELIDEVRAEYDSASARSALSPGEGMRVDVRQEIAADGTWYVVRCVEIDPLPTRWGLLAGDAVHNARSALDHLACRLVEQAGNQPTSRTAFPIWDRKPTNADNRRRFADSIAGMSPDHQDAIRRLQPYAMPGTPEAGNLGALGALDNLDKHTMLMPVAAVISEERLRTPQFLSLLRSNIEYRWNAGALLTPGVEILRYRPASERDSVAGVWLGIGLRATFGGPSTGLRELRKMRAHCVGIVESFAPEFP